ncbi:hypothetical protein D3C77_551580 [compost metagenome]
MHRGVVIIVGTDAKWTANWLAKCCVTATLDHFTERDRLVVRNDEVVRAQVAAWPIDHVAKRQWIDNK